MWLDSWNFPKSKQNEGNEELKQGQELAAAADQCSFRQLSLGGHTDRDIKETNCLPFLINRFGAGIFYLE